VKSLKLSAIAVTLAASMFSAGAYAQQKIGVVDAQSIFQSLPQAATIQQTINEEFKDQIADVKRLEEDLKYYTQKHQRDAAIMSEDEIKKLEESILTMRQEYAGKVQPLQQSVQQRTTEERNKILALIQQVVNRVAAAENFDLVLNSAAAAYAKPENDLSEKVVEEILKSDN
jgi:outer membrane protein